MRTETDELIESENGYIIHEIRPEGEGDYGGKHSWER